MVATETDCTEPEKQSLGHPYQEPGHSTEHGAPVQSGTRGLGIHGIGATSQNEEGCQKTPWRQAQQFF
jgi:hypothetical protein